MRKSSARGDNRSYFAFPLRLFFDWTCRRTAQATLCFVICQAILLAPEPWQCPGAPQICTTMLFTIIVLCSTSSTRRSASLKIQTCISHNAVHSCQTSTSQFCTGIGLLPSSSGCLTALKMEVNFHVISNVLCNYDV